MLDNEKDLDTLSEADDFWSLDSLLPPNEKKRVSASVNDISLADFEINGETAPSRVEKIPPRGEFPPITERTENRISFEKWLENRREHEKNKLTYGKKVVLEYAPNGKYIKKVTVSEETGRKAGGERFISDGQRILGLSSEFDGDVPFESFYPQYSQLNSEQLKCYIGFRTEVKKGIFPEVSRSYIYLYLYEIINFAHETPETRAERIVSLINGYPEADDRLFSDMCNWLTDLCLIYQLSAPKGIYGAVYPRVLERAMIKEFFLNSSEEVENGELAFLLTSSRYDYKKSKFYPEFSEYYDRYIPAAVLSEIEKLSKTDSRFSGNGTESCTVTRESYFGAFCSRAVRRTVSVELHCITKDEAVSKIVSDMVKYAENRLRSELMIKPRLSVIYLPVSIRDGIKGFFAERASVFPKKSVRKTVEKHVDDVPEYEKLYEPEESGISEEAAREIEKSSWETTERLVSAFEGDENEYTPPAIYVGDENESLSLGKYSVAETTCLSQSLSVSTENTQSDSCEGDRCVISALEALLSGDSTRFAELAKECGMLLPAFADTVNEFLFDIIEDSAVESDGDVFTLIEDYREDVSDIVSRYKERNI